MSSDEEEYVQDKKKLSNIEQNKDAEILKKFSKKIKNIKTEADRQQLLNELMGDPNKNDPPKDKLKKKLKDMKNLRSRK